MSIELTCENDNGVSNLLKRNIYYNSNIVNSVLLLTKFNVDSFELKYGDEIIGETIKYVDGKLVEYSNPSIRYKDKKLYINDRDNTGNYEIQEFLRKKELLDKTNNIEINKLDNLIIGSYRLFCNSNPDLSKMSIRDRIQILAYFLSFVLSPISYSTYFTRFDGDMPYNELIEHEMNKLEALTDEELNSLVISDKIKNGIVSLIAKLNNEYENHTLQDLVKLYHDYYSKPDADIKCEQFVKCIKKQ